MRIEPNISLRLRGTTELSETRTEIKNLNSISAMFHAVEYEIRAAGENPARRWARGAGDDGLG